MEVNFMNLTWNCSLSIGVDIIDDQHKELINFVNQFFSSIENEKSSADIINALNFLEEYVIKHFTEEEEIQKSTNYPLLDIQQMQHENFKKDLKEFRKIFETHGVSTVLALNIHQNLVDWIKNHIMNLDKDLGDFLIEIGYNK
jgi:hemerythrin